jgi:hypothetical protein
VCLILQGAVNMMPPRWIARFFALTGCYQLAASLLLIVLVPVLAPSHQSAQFVFTNFDTSTRDATGVPNNGYLFILGMLMSQYTVRCFPTRPACVMPCQQPLTVGAQAARQSAAEPVALLSCQHETLVHC